MTNRIVELEKLLVSIQFIAESNDTDWDQKRGKNKQFQQKLGKGKLEAENLLTDISRQLSHQNKKPSQN